MPISTPEIDAIQQALEAAGVEPNCSRCGAKGSVTIHNKGYAYISVGDDPLRLDASRGFPCTVLTCACCGAVYLHNLIDLKLLSPAAYE